jgi:tRNA U34 5-methylaminomethyl-2-thiouridine-forming methyltransferase MnmC
MQNPFESELIQTSDGSYTLKLKGHDEQYHSINGALQESMHVFLNSGYHYIQPKPNPMYVLEVGMGTGLNALITARETFINPTVIYYDAVEAYPLPAEVVKKLNYPRLFTEPFIDEAFSTIHQAKEESYSSIGNTFHIRCLPKKIQQVTLPQNHYHLVYFDAFGPDTQPELWSEEVFSKIYNSMATSSVLVTYCVKGSVRRAMKAAGFLVEKIPGPPGKREMSRAFKNS